MSADLPVRCPHAEGKSRGGLALMAVEAMDVGLLIVSRDFEYVCFANRAALDVLQLFGAPEPALPRQLTALLRSSVLADADDVPTRFTKAVPLSVPDGRRYFLRGKTVGCAQGCVLVSIAMATVRESDLRRLLAGQFGLNAQEIRVAFFAAQGYRNREIAHRLHIVEGTVKNYLTRIFASLSVRSRTELAGELHALAEDATQVTGQTS